MKTNHDTTPPREVKKKFGFTDQPAEARPIIKPGPAEPVPGKNKSKTENKNTP